MTIVVDLRPRFVADFRKSIPHLVHAIEHVRRLLSEDLRASVTSGAFARAIGQLYIEHFENGVTIDLRSLIKR